MRIEACKIPACSSISPSCVLRITYYNDNMRYIFCFRMIVDHDRKLAYCYIPKTGVTTWKMIMANNTLNGRRIPTGKDPKAWIHSRVEQFGLSKERYSPSLENYTKFMVVRHPFDRLLSAYYDKAFPQYIRNGRKVLTKIPRTISSFALRIYHQSDSEIDETNYNATFWEFVQFALAKGSNHWNSYANSCGQCFIDYDFIMRTETLQKDSNLFLSEHYPELSSLPTYNAMRKTGASHNVKIVKNLKEFKDFDENLILKLLDKYKLDFEHFGYHYHSKSQTASCTFQNGSDGICC